MFNLKKYMAIALIITFLASIPLANIPAEPEIIQFTYTIKADPNYAKPSGAGNGKPTADYQLIFARYQAETPLDLVVYAANDYGLSVDFVLGAITDAAYEWDAATSKQIINSVTLAGGFGEVVYNNINALFFGDHDDSNVIAQATIWANRITKQIVECDVQFNTDFKWGDGESNSFLMDLQNIATHELGHGFNLADIYDDSKSYLTMYGISYYGDVEKRTLADGDIAGIRKIYGS